MLNYLLPSLYYQRTWFLGHELSYKFLQGFCNTNKHDFLKFITLFANSAFFLFKIDQ